MCAVVGAAQAGGRVAVLEAASLKGSRGGILGFPMGLFGLGLGSLSGCGGSCRGCPTPRRRGRMWRIIRGR